MSFAKSGLSGLAFLLAAISGATADDGAAANVNACLFLQLPPQKPVSFRFIAGGPDDQCMYETGKDTKGVANTQGLTCVDIGTVKSKSVSSGGDFCLTADSIWSLAYIADNVRTPNGSTRSQWSNPLFGDNSVDLQDQTPGTHLCGTKKNCPGTKWKWSERDVPQLFVIFEPN